MNYEEKYKESLERAIIAHKDEDRHLKATLERIFPELKKSEDDKIREKLIRLVKKYWEGDEYCLIENVEQYESMLTWLEKQAPKLKWSEEDEELLQHCFGAAADYYTLDDKKEMENWLKSLKQRIKNNND